METSIVIMQCRHGGYIVKEYNVFSNHTPILFAGSLEDCLAFMQGWFMGDFDGEQT